MNNVLIRLRQACNHPFLLPGQEPQVRAQGLHAHLTDLWRGGRPTYVF